MLHFNQRHPNNDWSGDTCHFICSEGSHDYWLYKDHDPDNNKGHYGILVTHKDNEDGSYNTIQLSYYLNYKWFIPRKDKYHGHNIISRLFKLILNNKVLEFSGNQFYFHLSNYYTLRQIIAKRDHQSPEVLMNLFATQMQIITESETFSI